MQNFTVKDDEEIKEHIEVGDLYRIVSVDEVIEDEEKRVQIRFARVKG